MKSEVLDQAIRHLKKDPILKPHISPASRPPFRRPKKAYQSLVHSIIYQQLSGKAAATILKRFLGLFPGTSFPTPEEVLKLSDAEIRGVGISGQKMSYIRDLSERFIDGTISPRKFSKMTDEEIREHLVVVKGIGTWTADMFLMFTLYRPDVLPTGDLAIQKGFQKVFGLKSLPDAKTMQKLAQNWKPYRTVASWYLWRVVDGENSDW
ncbi:DNA-3-methyladenine glycosylase [Patescibacteria group bacterium]|nr:DNA-3-methyladenine glycosylase [Patescibacteria group bacterium]